MSKNPEIRAVINEHLVRIREALKDRVHVKVAEATGLHPNTIRNIVNNPNQSFSISTIEKLNAYLFPNKG